MAFRFALAFSLCSVVASIAIPVEHEDHNDSPAEYEFSYAVNDHTTGDIKSHQETRKGHAVTGKYELIDSDGYRRIVEYTADEHTGFNAIVHREPTDIKIPIFESHHPYQSHESSQHYAQQSHAPAQHHDAPAPSNLEHSHIEQSHHATAPVQQAYVAPKVAKKVVKPIVKVTPIEVIEPEHQEDHVLQVKYVGAPAAKIVEHTLSTHVTYNAPEFNYHY